MNLPQSAASQGRFVVNMATSFVDDIPADRFGVMPDGITTNHPAFLLAHLNIYPDKAVLPLIGKADLAQPFEKWDAVAAPGKDCVNDPDGSVYGTKDDIVAAFRDRMLTAADAVEITDPVIFEHQNPNEAVRARFPTIGAVIGFLMGPHATFHLGQLSAYRRCIGMAPAF
ncbi:MAG: DinB family protein [Planctomycetota bacterium]